MREAAGLVRFVVDRTFVDPVRAGRLRSTGWPAGLRSFVAVMVLLYVVVAATAVLATPLRRRVHVLFLPPDQSLPQLAVPVLGVAATATLTCLFAAALHTRVAFRVAVTVVVVAVLLAPVDWRAPTAVDLVTAGVVALLPLIMVVRGRRAFHWAEPVVSGAVVALAVVCQQAVALGPYLDVAPGAAISGLGSLQGPLWALAAPVSVLAGATLVEVTTSAATWTATGWWDRAARRRRARAWTTAALVALVAVRVVQEVRRETDPTASGSAGRLALAGLVVLVVAAGCAASTALADRREAGDARVRPDPDDLLPVWHRCAPPLAIALGATIGLQLLLGTVLSSFGLQAAGTAVLRADGAGVVLVPTILTTAAVLVAAAVLSVRGWRRVGLVLTATGLMYAFQTVFTVSNLLTGNDDVVAVATAVAVGLLVWLAARRRLTARAEVAIAGVLLLTAAYGYRDWLDEPLTAAVSLSGVSAALLVGLVWRLLTDNGFARGDSPGFPLPSRVLLALANALVGVTAAALVALSGGRSLLDASRTESVGDGVLGFPLVLAVVFAGLTLAARGRDVRPSSAREELAEDEDEGVRVGRPGPEPAG